MAGLIISAVAVIRQETEAMTKAKCFQELQGWLISISVVVGSKAGRHAGPD